MTAPMPSRDELIDTLNALSDAFHKIAMSYEADRMLAADRVRVAKMSTKMIEAIKQRCLTDDQRGQLCMSGFETCVRMLVQLGAPDAAIHSCNPSPTGEDGE